jgi:chorismate mutase/prephenate dehydratase
MLKEKGLREAAAVASEKAAEIYGMNILAREIEDNPENYTRFFVLSKKDSPITGRDKTSIIFAASHTPGSLYHALGEFARQNRNRGNTTFTWISKDTEAKDTALKH